MHIHATVNLYHNSARSFGAYHQKRTSAECAATPVSSVWDTGFFCVPLPARNPARKFFEFMRALSPSHALRALFPPCTGREIPGCTGSKEWSVKHAAGRVQFPGRFPSDRLVQGFPTRESVLQTVLPGHQGGIGGNELLRMHSMTFLLVAPDSFVFLPVLPPGGRKPITRGNYLPRSSLSMISLASGACLSIFSGNPK